MSRIYGRAKWHSHVDVCWVLPVKLFFGEIMNFKVFDQNQYLEALMSKQNTGAYGAMYSSWVGGIVTDARLMMIPIDDHMVHRGDAVFEAFKFVFGAFYDLKSHLRRLRTSADFIALNIPYSDAEIGEICKQLIEVSGYDEAMFRLYVSRGPGDFSPNPYSTLGSQLYIIVTPFKRMSDEKYLGGSSLIKSDVPV
jgi:branched-chain amino acid aminotransferase